MYDERVPIDAYNKFWDDWGKLPSGVQNDVSEFLDLLQRNPYNPELLRNSAVDDDERFAHRLQSGYVVYWSIAAKPSSHSVSVTSFEGMRINLLAILVSPHKA